MKPTKKRDSNAWRRGHRDAANAWARAWYQRRREAILARKRAWREAHPDKMREYRERAEEKRQEKRWEGAWRTWSEAAGG